jgi:acetylornithine/N-succinyldiaminopimelate aminotransferase
VTSPLLPTYARADISFERGEGAWLVSRDGQRYLDFGAGIAVNALGHAHPHLVKALSSRPRRSGTPRTSTDPEGERLAQRLVDHTFADVVFFSNSGAEANEAAIKMARKHHAGERTARSASASSPSRAPSTAAPSRPSRRAGRRSTSRASAQGRGLRPGALRRHEALKAAITPETAAIMIEPIQGEGGVPHVSSAFLAGCGPLCDQHGLLLIFDEIQTGIGRTGQALRL